MIQNVSYLSHHGIMGMHWGIRRYQPYGSGGYNRKGGETGNVVGEARKQQRTANKIYRNTNKESVNSDSAYGDLAQYDQPKVRNMREVRMMHRQLKDARKEMRSSMKVAEEYNRLSEKEQDKYIRQAAENAWNLYKNDSVDTEETREYYYNWFKYEDGDRGRGGSFDFYCRSKGTTYDSEQKKMRDAYRKYKESCKRVVRATVGEYADMPVSTLTYKKDSIIGKKGQKHVETIEDVATQALMDLSYEDMQRKKYYDPS